jgi:hypothetical protein
MSSFLFVNRDKDVKKGKAEVLEVKFYDEESPSKS